MVIIAVSSILLVSLSGGGVENAFALNISVTPVSSVSQDEGGVGTFSTLNAPIGVTTVEIDSRTYALVASRDDGGVQIINMTIPATPTVVSSISEGDIDDNGDTFDRLDGARVITTVEINSSTYALVGTVEPRVARPGFQLIASGIQIIDITNPAMPIATSSVSYNPSGFDKLDGVYDIAITEINGSTYAVATSVGAYRSSAGVQIINISNPADPYPVSSIEPDTLTDIANGVGKGFDQLTRPNGVTIVEIGDSTYALVADNSGDGIQIINISNPAYPMATSSISNDDTGFTLDGPRDIITHTVGAITYAIVTTDISDGVQIINISNPANPTAVSSITDGSTFNELDGANEIATVQIGGVTYALVASTIDDGVQIINLSDPAAPTAASIVTNTDEFSILDGASGITTVEIDSIPYAIITSIVDDGVHIINISTPTAPAAVLSIPDDTITFDTLDGPIDVTTVKIGSVTYALVASAAAAGDGVQIIDITDPAAPTVVSSISDGDTDGSGGTFDELDGARSIVTVEIGGMTYALVASIRDNGVQVINISDPAAPIDTNSFGALVGTRDITAVTIGGSTYALTSGFSDRAVRIYDISDPTTRANTAIISGNTYTALDNPRNITTVVIDGSTYALIAASGNANVGGVQIVDITTPGSPSPVAAITDGTGGFDTLGGARNIATVTIDSDTYALVTANSDDGVQIINMTTPATPIVVSSVTDGNDGFDTLDGANAITIVTIDNFTYALVTASIDRGVQIINITDPANPTPSFSISDSTTLAGANGITTVEIAGTTYALVAANGADGIEIVRIEDPKLKLVLDIDQDPLPTITFNDAVLDITLDANGVGSLEFASLVQPMTDFLVRTINTDNTDVIQFILDPAGPYEERNPDDTTNLADGTPFQLEDFQTGVHTVVYNKTHFTFNFDNPQFSGPTPPVSFRASIHTAADVTPIRHSDMGIITFNIIPESPVCGNTVTDMSLDFGNLRVDAESVDGTIVIQNSGNFINTISIGADYWCAPVPGGTDECVGDNSVMEPRTTHFGITSGLPYSGPLAFPPTAKTPFVGILGSFVPGTTPSLLDLFRLAPTTENTAYLQVSIDLLPTQSEFTGAIVQYITLDSDCS